MKKEIIKVKVNQTKLPSGHHSIEFGGRCVFRSKKGKGSYRRKNKHSSKDMID